jgi:maleate cis-trans isomerase
MAASKSRPKKRALGDAPNYLIEVKGKLVVVSGATGEVKALSQADVDLVLPLLRARQELGKRLAELLEERGFDFSPQATVELVVEPPESERAEDETPKRSRKKRSTR